MCQFYLGEVMIFNRQWRIYIFKFWTHAPPVQFSSFSCDFWPNNRLAPPFELAPLWEILDSPLIGMVPRWLLVFATTIEGPRIFQMGSQKNRAGGSNLLLVQYSPKTAWNWKKIGPEGGGKGTSHAPLNPLMTAVCLYLIDTLIGSFVSPWFISSLLLTHLALVYSVPVINKFDFPRESLFSTVTWTNTNSLPFTVFFFTRVCNFWQKFFKMMCDLNCSVRGRVSDTSVP